MRNSAVMPGTILGIALAGLPCKSAPVQLNVKALGPFGMAVPEGKGGEFSWSVTNTGSTNVTVWKQSFDILHFDNPGFGSESGDPSDQPMLMSISGCTGTDKKPLVLVASVGTCILTMKFTTPAPDAKENADRISQCSKTWVPPRDLSSLTELARAASFKAIPLALLWKSTTRECRPSYLNHPLSVSQGSRQSFC